MTLKNEQSKHVVACTMSLALSDLTTEETDLLRSTRIEDKTETDATIACIYQILLLAYSSTDTPSLADVLNAQREYFTNNSNNGNDDVNERTYQYILDLSLSSESDWYSKLAVESNHGIQTTGNVNNNHLDEDDSATNSNSCDVPALLSWAAHYWLDTSFGNRHLALPQQVTSFETKHSMELFASKHPGLSQMQIRGRENDRANWWTGNSLNGLSLYLSSTAALKQWELKRIFHRWERGAALFQRTRYRAFKLQTILARSSLKNGFNEWARSCAVDILSERYFIHRHFKKWNKWLSEIALREPFDGWILETKRWKRKVIAFEYWCNRFFHQQKLRSFTKWKEMSRSLTLSLNVYWARHYFIRWSNFADSTWETRAYYRSAAENAQRIRRLRIKIWGFNGWQTYIRRIKSYIEAVKRLDVLATLHKTRVLRKAMQTWFHEHMMDLHEDHLSNQRSVSLSSDLHSTKGSFINLNVLGLEENLIHQNQMSTLQRIISSWSKKTIQEKNQRKFEDIATHHLRERRLGHAFFNWNLILVDEHRQQRKMKAAIEMRKNCLLKKGFFSLILYLISRRRLKIKEMEACIFWQKGLLEKFFLNWRRLKFIDIEM